LCGLAGHRRRGCSRFLASASIFSPGATVGVSPSFQSVIWNEALKINGFDPDFHRRDLWDAIQSGDFPEWELGLQVFDDAFCDRFPFDVLDPTKVIPEEDVPVQRVGRLVLNRCVDNFFAETEQVAFCTQNIVPGIDFTNDPLLQGRNFSYLDTQLKRLGGPNFTHLPINAPKCPLRTLQQDGIWQW
jgi:catalase